MLGALTLQWACQPSGPTALKVGTLLVVAMVTEVEVEAEAAALMWPVPR